jgi:hypothetical protein
MKQLKGLLPILVFQKNKNLEAFENINKLSSAHLHKTQKKHSKEY